MRKALILTLAGVTSLVTFSSAADARDGCGSGFHRDRYGECARNYGYNRRDGGYNDRYYRSRDDSYRYDRDRSFGRDPEIGAFYPDRGYWSGDQFYTHRRWDNGDWRYW